MSTISNTNTMEHCSAIAGVYKNGFFKPAVKLPTMKISQKAVLVLFEEVYGITEELIASSPPTRNPKIIMDEFRKTGKYSEQFLKSLKKGLTRSSYFK